MRAQDARLLRAAFDDDADAVRAAWAAWCSADDLQTTDDASLQLMALVGRNLARHAIADPTLDRLRGLRRHQFVEHTRLVAQLAPVLQALHAEDIQPAIIGPLALASIAYGELGLRAPTPSALLLAPSDVAGAVRCLRAHGFQPQGQHPPTLHRALLGLTNLADQGYGHTLRWGRERVTLDLSWALMPSQIGPDSDAALRGRLGQVRAGDLSFATPSPADHLLWALQQAAAAPTEPAYIGDVLALTARPIDWAVFTEEAVRRGLSQTLHAQLAAIVEAFPTAAGAPRVPIQVLRALATSLSPRARPPGLAQLAPHLDGRNPGDAARVAARFAVHRLAATPRINALRAALRPAWRVFKRFI